MDGNPTKSEQVSDADIRLPLLFTFLHEMKSQSSNTFPIILVSHSFTLGLVILIAFFIF
jgi:hypothetical protein